MAYQHIMVAVDLSDDSFTLVTKAAELAKALDAKLSLIHIDVNYAELYTGLIDINLAEAQHRMAEDAQKQLQALAQKANYPVSHTLVGSGDLSEEICLAINDIDVELVVCGHHQDFWSKVLSSAKQLINRTPVDLLMVPLK
ncbi:universal stress protein [Photobacterium atrarenae]|uniref:Universal stress protein n=1 Tax=Photobacterium atrarenae TaxID=865757 RepID=A0ABY5GEY4_9GAMM|nr:universal stress protein [Photobacterium atrarenae]UTV27814.1 universal stress protein [Photobacterium atrarenae]